jgi:cyclomaltodextrinase / maltogenic alpha-amylase / neopullulanase
MMRFTNLLPEEKLLYERVKKITNARKNSVALIYGDFNEIIQKDNLWVFSRKYFNHEAVIVFYKGSAPEHISIPLTQSQQGKKIVPVLGSSMGIVNNSLVLTLTADGVEIFLID